jgi:hypothetical protein
MSLHNLAHHLQSAGRGEDKVLVHMTPGEVNGLQSLAMSQGGSLTINPQTGLPEAGILSSLLPIVAGAFLGPAGLGLTAMQTGLAVGALGTAATGSLGKGLMMGFGAYGGAGLGEGLMNAGASAMPGAGTAANATTSGINTGTAAAEAAKGSSYTGTKAAIDTGVDATTKTVQSGALPSYQAQGYNNIFSNPNYGNYAPMKNLGEVSQMPISGTASSPLDVTMGSTVPTAPKITYATSSHPFDYTSKLAKIQNDPLMEAQIGAKGTISPSVAPVPTAPAAPVSNFDKVGAGIKDVTSSGTKAWNFVKEHPTPFIGVGVGALQEMQEQKAKDAAAAANAGKSPGMIRPYEMSVAQNQSAYAPNASTAERQFFEQPRYRELTPYAAKEGGLMGINKYAVGGPVEQMSAQNAVGSNTMYPQSQLQTPMYSNPMAQRPMPTNVIQSGLDAPTDRYTGEQTMGMGVTPNYSIMEQGLAMRGAQMQSQNMASGGVADGYNLGGYSDGGRLLRGPGDGVSDSIPASIGNRQPARLADGEFVVPARIVSEIGNGSTEAGARKLYAMMDRVQKARGKTTGKNKVAVNTKADKLLPA